MALIGRIVVVFAGAYCLVSVIETIATRVAREEIEKAQRRG
jgi:hypothetical protein